MVISDPEDLPNFTSGKDEDLIERMDEKFSASFNKLKDNDLFKSRFLGLMKDIKKYSELEIPA